ncbi:unnamed protein product [Symbiodinium pilosum]|uniref:K Homology domain-containing protein n=1 Tax=Symbiodinium pilosum TaxID=2952 RepID=A0A812SE63_SYMPI|nr:unnamed protein product [Symbiodinium pilosum]
MAEPEEGDEEVAKAVEQTPEELPRVPCHLFLPVVPAARVIGKRGANIKEIRDKSGAVVKILQKELPQEMQRREDRVAAISGEPAAVREAISGVLERVFDRSGLPDTADASARDRGYIVEVLVPEKCGSHLIGQKGERVKTLCQAPHSLRGLSWGGGRDEVYFFQIWGLCKAWRVGPSRTCSVKVLWRPGFRHLASVVTA